jgi:hypothetical protein
MVGKCCLYCFGFCNKKCVKNPFSRSDKSTSLNQSVACLVIKGFDRTKVKIWPGIVQRPTLICKPVFGFTFWTLLISDLYGRSLIKTNQKLVPNLTLLSNLVPRVFPLGEGRKDSGRRCPRDLLKSSGFLISNPRRGQ